MKILKLTAENIKRLVAIEIAPDGNVVQITGKNKQGKTSVLDSIWWALAGTKHIQTSPIRKGQNKARVKLELGEINVERRFTRVNDDSDEYNTSLIVTNADGAKYPSPQTMLDALLGELAFDPLGFMRMPADKQREAFKQFVTDVDLDEIEVEQKNEYERRTRANREAKDRRARAEGIDVVKGDLPNLIDESALVAELDEAGKTNASLEKRRAGREQAQERLKALEGDIRELEARLSAKRADHKELADKLASAEQLPDPVDTTELRARIDEARQSNERVHEITRQRADRKRLLDEAAEFEATSEKLTKSMAARAKAKADAIANAKLPIEGLSLDEHQVLFNGVPLEQASDAEQLRISVAIAAALNPKLRVIRVRDGSLLDSDGLRLLAEFADANDMQVWVERVDESGEVGFVIEDGHLKEPN